jgi:hypothetical protein
MKMLAILTMTLVSISTVYGQKVDAPKTTEPNERELSSDDVDKLTITLLKDHLLSDEYKIAEYNAKRAPILAQQQDLHDKLCLSVGVPKDKLSTNECQITGFGQDGAAVLGPDGKPMPHKVYYVKPQPTATK